MSLLKIPFRLLLTVAFIFSFKKLVTSQTVSVPEMMDSFNERKYKAILILNTKQKKDTQRVNALLDVLNTSYFHKQRKELYPFYTEALRLSESLEFEKGISSCYIWMAFFYRGEKDFEKFYKYMDSSIEITEGKSALEPIWAKAHRMKGLQYQEDENYYAALKHYFEALKYYEKSEEEHTHHLYQNITSSYFQLNNIKKAIEYGERGAVLADRANTTKIIKLQAYSSLASVYVQQNRLDDAAVYLKRIQPYMPDSIEQSLTSNYYIDWGQIFFKKKQYDSSFFYYKLGYDFAATGNHNLNKYGSLNYLFKNSLQLGNQRQALNYANMGMQEALKSNKIINRIDALYNLADYYETTGAYKKAFAHLKEGSLLKDSFSQQNNLTTINNLSELYEADKKQNEINTLQKEKKLNKAYLDQKIFLNRIYGLGLITMGLIITLSFLYYRNRQKIQRQAGEIQKQKIVELEKDQQLIVANSMLKGQEEERERIAKDLHDGLGSLLSGAKLSFSKIKEMLKLPVHEKMIYENSLSILDKTMVEMRKIAHNIMPEELLKFGISEALKDFCTTIEKSSGIDMQYSFYGENREISNTVSLNIFRIIQELVNNAIKHANASNILVQLAMAQNTINITIEDNGIGYNIDNPSDIKGKGLENIRHRVSHLGGHYDITSDEGKGTSVNIIFGI